jgi:hypothetical protein
VSFHVLLLEVVGIPGAAATGTGTGARFAMASTAILRSRTCFSRSHIALTLRENWFLQRREVSYCEPMHNLVVKILKLMKCLV